MRTRDLFGIVSLFVCATVLGGCKDDKAEDGTSYPLIFVAFAITSTIEMPDNILK